MSKKSTVLLELMKIPARYRKASQQMTMVYQSLGDHVLDAALGLPYSVHGQKP
jgi:hypothetical protein